MGDPSLGQTLRARVKAFLPKRRVTHDTKHGRGRHGRARAKLTAPLNLVRGGFNGVGGKRVKLATIAGDGGAGLVAVEPDRGELREEGDPDPRQPKRRKSSRPKTGAERSLV